MTKAKGPLAPVVAVLNMKGGVGKTTISAHVMRHLWQRLQKSTLLVDFDPQFNLSQTLLSKAQYDLLRDEGKTIATVMEPDPSPSLFKVTTGLGPPPDERAIARKLRYFVSAPDNNIALIPGHFNLTKYSLIEDQKSLVPIRQRFLDFVKNARTTRDLVCIDCNPSSSFMTLCALLACTHVLVPVRPDRYSVLGLQLLDQFIAELDMLTAKPRMIVILNGLRGHDTEASVEAALRADSKFGPMVLGNTLRHSEHLAANDKYIGFATDKNTSHISALRTRLSKIVDELKGPLGW